MATRVSTDDGGLRPPRLQTNLQRPSTAPDSPTPWSPRVRSPPQSPVPRESEESNRVAVQPGFQRFVLTDPVAFRYLEEDPATSVLAREQQLKGFECYVVEQWTTSRMHPTFVITTYTGDTSHSVVVSVLSVPIDEAKWSPRLRIYFKALNQYHARRRDTPLGIMMVTSLSGFPSSLTVIPVPDGDLRKHRTNFFVNENLKRLGCAGRVGLTLLPASSATVAKFHQLYRISDKNEIYQSVIELVKLCQAALSLFDKLEVDYADGLLCDVTERAITDWWMDVGNEHYTIEPHDGILGPTTVAALLGLLMGARNRLHAVNAPVSKDAFDVESFKRGVGHFQKQQRMPRTRRLDRRTLDRLHKLTQKAAEHEGWSVPKVMKTTVAELSGKGGEMVLDAVGRRDRAGLAEIETCDIDRFSQLVYGDRCRWLWLGRQPKKHKEYMHDKAPAYDGPELQRHLTFKQDEQGGFSWTARKSTVNGRPSGKLPDDLHTPIVPKEESSDEEDPRRQGVLKRASGFKNEAKHGLGKIKGAVGLRNHQLKQSTDDSPTTPIDETGRTKRPVFGRSQTSPSSPVSPARSLPMEQTLTVPTQDPRERVVTDPGQQRDTLGRQQTLSSTADVYKGAILTSSNTLESRRSLESRRGDESDRISEEPSGTNTAEPSITGSVYNGIDLHEALPSGPATEKDSRRLMRRTLSLTRINQGQSKEWPNDYYPRHLSFTLAEDSLLRWDSIVDDDSDACTDDDEDEASQLKSQELQTKQAQNIQTSIDALSSEVAEWTHRQLETLSSFLRQADDDQLDLDKMYGPHSESIDASQAHSEGVLRDQRNRLEEDSKEIETLAAKLEYEISGLKGRIEDVDAGVGDFEKGVSRVEERIAELEKDTAAADGQWGCVVS